MDEKRWCTCLACMGSWNWTQSEYHDHTDCPACKGTVWAIEPTLEESKSVAARMRKTAGIL
jgi:Zn finger protein HypA/HybF involved in hydrogenase expression